MINFDIFKWSKLDKPSLNGIILTLCSVFWAFNYNQEDLTVFHTYVISNVYINYVGFFKNSVKHLFNKWKHVKRQMYA